MLCPITDLTMKLIRCNSISPNDAGCQTIIIKHLLAIGFTVEYMNIGNTKNFWAWHGGNNYDETLAFSGHTDVVPIGNISQWTSHPFEPTIRNGILFGRGAADMKGSLAAMIIAAERFISSNPNHNKRLAFLITSDEEASAENGTVKVIETLMARNERLDYCIIGEPTSTEILGDVIKNGRRGSLTCDLIIHGIQGHIAYPHLINNPIHISVPMLNELTTIKWDHGNEFFPPTSMQIINIKAGTNINNVVPGDLFLQFNFRFGTELTDEIIKKHVIFLLKKYKLKYTIKWQLSSQPFLTRRGKLVDVVTNAITQYNKVVPQLLTTGGSSDGRFIAKMGTQIVELGPINSTIHKINECVNIADLQLLTRIYQLIMEQLLN